METILFDLIHWTKFAHSTNIWGFWYFCVRAENQTQFWSRNRTLWMIHIGGNSPPPGWNIRNTWNACNSDKTEQKYIENNMSAPALRCFQEKTKVFPFLWEFGLVCVDMVAQGIALPFGTLPLLSFNHLPPPKTVSQWSQWFKINLISSDMISLNHTSL